MRQGHWLGWIGALLLLAACTPAGPREHAVTKSGPSAVTMAIGEVLALTINGNPTTGYLWEQSAGDDLVLASAGEPEYTADSQLIGAGGTYVYRWTARAAGTTTLELVYHRPWETEPPADVYRIAVTVR
ncbi:MAG: protease inhibitor I42 family protein [Chloroflexi bacterium]|nr:protease inhibitor I42 family protein [Chloroflexota bacterium]